MYGHVLYVLQEISLRNYNSALGTSPLKCYHNSFVIFSIVCTRPYINNYLLWNEHQSNLDDLNIFPSQLHVVQIIKIAKIHATATCYSTCVITVTSKKWTYLGVWYNGRGRNPPLARPLESMLATALHLSRSASSDSPCRLWIQVKALGATVRFPGVYPVAIYNCWVLAKVGGSPVCMRDITKV